MKSTGIVRKVDCLGRLVIPKELRKVLEIEECDPVEVFIDGDSIVLKKYEPGCIFCGEIENIRLHKGKNICGKCIKQLKG